MEYLAGTADVAVIGAGHAGVEAALACARMGIGHRTFHNIKRRRCQYAVQPVHRRYGKGSACV